MTDNRDPQDHSQSPQDDVRQAPIAGAMEEAVPPFHLPPLPRSRRAEIRVPASINGRDLSQGQP
jgi:hypothetical protein